MMELSMIVSNVSKEWPGKVMQESYYASAETRDLVKAV